ncbi:MAG: hypothetical protein JNG88_00990 [Phycisphaerales bacterium]|nr:hypothetical protein [Phycisphaerales bacterium]
MRPKFTVTALLALAGWGAAAATLADDTVINFEDYAVGTAITTQYDGVTFSAPPNSCGGSPPIQCVIVNPNGGASSGSRALSVQTGCPDFSVDYIRMVFDEGHAKVSFTLGDSPGTYNVRAYTATSGGSPVYNQNIVISGTGWAGVYRLVLISRASPDIRRVEIDDTVDDFEVIDDLTFDCPDATPPTAELSSPAALSCVCYGVSIHGTAADTDGALASWRLDRKAPGADTWTLLRNSTTEVIDGELSPWFPGSSATEGYYIMRLTVTNACGLVSTAETVFYLERVIDELSIRSPLNGAILGGQVCIDGTAWDHCFESLAAEYQVEGGGAWQPMTSVASDPVRTDPYATWNTNTVADGDYLMRFTLTDSCGFAGAINWSATIDNTAPFVAFASPDTCTYQSGVIAIRGTVLDAHLSRWTLEVTGGDWNGWHPLTSGETPIVNGVLLNWDTRGLPLCAYTLRLVATDSAVLNCNSASRNRSETMTTFVLGRFGDMNCDGLVNNFDIDPFVYCLSTGDCHCP